MSNISRRAVLRGGAVGLCLPWLETLAPKKAAAQTAPIRRYMNMYFPNGTADWWFPATPGSGSAWSISPILEPLTPTRSNILVLGNVSNYATYAGMTPNPSHGSCCGGAWHCYDPRMGTSSNAGGGISVDQVIAGQIGSLTPLPSLQLGLSTLDSSCDGTPCAHARSVSWSGANKPLYKTVNPQAVFDQLVTAGAPSMVGQTKSGSSTTNNNMPNPALAQTKALQKSVLDSVLDSAMTLRTKLSMGDQSRLDQYMTSVRDLEKLVAAPAMQVTGGGVSTACVGIARPPEAYADMNTPSDYSRETHANLMIQLAAFAFACDITRTISFMLDDSRSDYVYSHVPMRLFNSPAAGTLSSPGTGTCAGYHGLQHAGNANDGFSTITWWNASKANQMAQALINIPEGSGSVFDSTVIHFGAGMHGGNHDASNLPIVLIGSGGGVLKQNAYMALTGDAPGATGGARLANLHLTLMQKVFGCTLTTFGVPGGSTGIITDILA